MAKGIDVDTFDTNGLTPLMWAVLRSQGPDTIRVLLALGADPNLTDRLGYQSKVFLDKSSDMQSRKIEGSVVSLI